MERAASGRLLQELQQDREQLPCQDSQLRKNIGFVLLVQAGGSVGGKAKAQVKPRAVLMVLCASSYPAQGSGNSLVGLQLLHNAPEIEDREMLQQQVKGFGVLPKLCQEELQEDQEAHVVLHKDAAASERLAWVLLQEAGETRGFVPDLPLLVLQKVNAHIYQPGEREEKRREGKATACPRASPACREGRGG